MESPFWSPDNQAIGFFDSGKLLRVDVNGGRPLIVCDAPIPRGGTWNADGTILVADARGLSRVSATGGAAVSVLSRPGVSQNYAVTRDGQRFLLLVPTGEQQPAPISVVLNWPALLKH